MAVLLFTDYYIECRKAERLRYCNNIRYRKVRKSAAIHCYDIVQVIWPMNIFILDDVGSVVSCMTSCGSERYIIVDKRSLFC